MNIRSLFSLLVLLPGCARAADHFLTIGGGASPQSTQVSLEKNVLFSLHVLEGVGLKNAPDEILFADGADPGRDVEFDDPKYEPPRANVLLAEILGQENGLTSQYRSNQIPKVWGAATRANLDRWFDQVGKNLRPDDRLIIYFTGHGHNGDAQGRNNTFTLWNEQPMSVTELNARLEKLPPKVRVVMVMVQCYCGGFSDLVFKAGEQKKGLADRDLCGFFATVRDRQAAGCTPDIDEENYQEYSTFFLAALCGQKRTGEPVTDSDYDRDGVVSLAEAHAYAVLNSDTIDIPVKTSDTVLRAYAKPDEKAPYSRLLTLAGPADRAVLEGLSAKLQLTGELRLKAAQDQAAALVKQRAELDAKRKRLQKTLQQDRKRLRWAVQVRWPELDNLIRPQAIDLLTHQADAIVRYVESQPDFKRFDDTLNELEKISRDDLDLERKWAKCQRFVRVAQNVTLAPDFEKSAPKPVQEKYRQILASESATLGTRPTARPAK